MVFQPGTFQYLREIGAFRPVKVCPRCGRWVSRWHKHWTDPGESADATKEPKK